MKPLQGIHHVTAITGDAQRNADFYSGALGLRLVKKTVNFDDPGSYHLYYGDRAGSPGTLVTFFEWPHAAPGKRSAGEPVAITFAIPENALAWWSGRFQELGLEHRITGNRLLVQDPDGLHVELIETPESFDFQYWSEGAVSEPYAIKGIYSTALVLGSPERSHGLYTNELGFIEIPSDSGAKRYKVGASWIEVAAPETASHGRMGAGTIHHIAFRAESDAAQREWLQHLTHLGLNVSPVMDRKYFHSIYFRERNGVLFEIATDEPGMGVDEPVERLGESLALPEQYEPMRDALQRQLTPVIAGRSPVHI